MPDDADLLQRFVDCFTRLDDSTFSHNDPPLSEFAAGIDPNDWNVIRSQPAAISTPPASLDVIRKVGALPQLYEQLATSFRWPDVDLGICRMLPNFPADDLGPLAAAMFADPVLNSTLIPNGFSRFGMAPDYCYDPFCFDLNRFRDNDCPIVRLNHESILSYDRLGDVVTVFASFRELVHAVLAIETR